MNELGRDICGDWTAAASREWLVTNGLGGYACGTVAGANTRRYHAFLMASLKPPVERTLLVAKIDVTIHYRGKQYSLSANEFADGTVDPRGFVHLESFAVQQGLPVWRYAIADALLEQRIFMAPGENTSYLQFELRRASEQMSIELKPLATFRGYHSQCRGRQLFRAIIDAAGCAVAGPDGAPLYRLAVKGGHYVPRDLWYWNFLHREEAERGLDALEDLWSPGIFQADLTALQSIFLTATAEQVEPSPGAVVHAALIARSQVHTEALPRSAPPWVHQLAIGTDQFIVRRGERSGAAQSVIAGYPWFADWGRDTMIALPGLTTVLGRHGTAGAVLRTFAALVDRGMLPNRFPDTGATLEYNTADATLWLFRALAEQLDAAPDPALLRDLYPPLMGIIHAHIEGTRYGIGVDRADGLLRAGEPGSQLTWMDARHDDHAATPRVGKPVEINALWLNALEVARRLAAQVGSAAEQRLCEGWLQQAVPSFMRFWNEERGCLFDVIDVDGGTGCDASIRPNQIFAVSLPLCLLPAHRMRAVVDTCAAHLLTSYGLRTLSPDDPAYVGCYRGGPAERDAAYHQGTVWSWLLGPFALAHYRAYGDARRAQSYLEPIAQHLAAACVGSVSEIFDGDAPHSARGCFAQAWSVAEILRSWVYLESR